MRNISQISVRLLVQLCGGQRDCLAVAKVPLTCWPSRVGGVAASSTSLRGNTALVGDLRVVLSKHSGSLFQGLKTRTRLSVYCPTRMHEERFASASTLAGRRRVPISSFLQVAMVQAAKLRAISASFRRLFVQRHM